MRTALQWGWWHRDRGATTLEVAIGMLTLTVFTTALGGIITVLAVHLQVVDAARTSARLLARGDSTVTASAAVARGCESCRMQVRPGIDRLEVEVSRSIQPVPLLPPYRVAASAIAYRE